MPLTTDQLQAIQRLISEPLRDTVRAEMQVGHERLAAGIQKLSDQLTSHAAEAQRREHAVEGKLGAIERRIGALEQFRGKVLLVYGVLTLAISFSWSVLREWALVLVRRR